MLGLFSLFLVGVALATDYDFHLCDNMENKQCQKVASEVFNYTVPEIRRMTTVMRKITEQRVACKIAGVCPTARPSIIGARTPCVGGSAAGYDCQNIDLLAFVSLSALGSSGSADGNDIWGYTDSNNRRYAITGQTDGASIVDITDPESPDVLCFLQSYIATLTVWRDIKLTVSNAGTVFAMIVADRSGQGLQYVALDDMISTCRSATGNPPTIPRGSIPWIGGGSGGVYTGGTNTHNIVGRDRPTNNDGLFEPTDTVYLSGSGSSSGGLIAVSMASGSPVRTGQFPSDGYSHDAECWIYGGPDTRFTGNTICVGYNENSVTIVDYTNPSSPQQLSRTTYSTSAYTHQGWRTPDQAYLLMNDELDESRGRVPSQTTYILDIRSLTNPVLTPWYSGITSIDHNLYIRRYGGTTYAFEANYRSGLRILNANSVGSGSLSQTGFFKTWTGSYANSFNGAWSNYPYFDASNCPGLVVVQDIEQGLFILDAADALGVAKCS